MKTIRNLIAGITFLVLAPIALSGQHCFECEGNLASGDKSMALGYNNLASGYCSAAIGIANEATGDYSFAAGYQSICNHNFSAIVGSFDTITNYHSFILGSSSKATGKNAIVVGNGSKSLANFALTIGYHVQSRASEAFTIGSGIVDNPLINTSSRSLIVGFNSNLPTFIVDRAPGVNKTGKIGIGNVPDPQAKLHIRADENENAMLRIENTGSDKLAGIVFGDSSQSITTSQDMPFTFNSGQNDFFFESGKIGIGTNSPEQKLDVDGTLKSTGFKLVDGSQAYGRILQSDDQGNATWIDAPGGGCVQCEGGDNSGTNASIIGTNNIASGNSSFAGGEDSEAQGKQSFAFGENALTMSAYSVAMGQEVTAFGGASIVLGRNLMTTTSAAMIIGTGFDDTHNLINDKHSSLMVGFNSTKPTFFVSESNGSNSTGKIGIGNVTDPQAKLHILGDANSYNPTEASLLIESAGNQYSTLWIGDKNHSIYTRPDSDFKFSTSLNTNFVFENGNVGIGTNEPAAKIQVKDGDIFIEDIDRGIIMKSPDGNCWRGTVNNQGQMQFTQIDCSTLETGTQSPEPSGASTIKIYPNPAKAQVVVDCSNSKEVLYLEVTDMSGKLMHRQTIPNAVNTLSSADWPAGMYFFNFKNNRGTSVETIKVVKEE